MNILKITALTSAACLAAYFGYKYVAADPPGYCRAQQRYITDKEFINLSVKLREEEIAQHGGLDTYEKWIASNATWRTTDDAGRDFDSNNPNCCRIYRGEKVERNCGWDYPICVKLNYRTSRENVEGGDIGRTYFFDNCGNEKNPL